MNLRTTLAIGAAVGGALLLRRRLALREDLDWRDVDKTGDVIEIDGYGVHYVDVGHGPVMLMLHGFGGSTYSCRHLIPVFARSSRVIAVDLKGFGYSERATGAGFSAAAQVAMLKELLDRCAVTRAVVIGHSMGGGIAQRFAATHPEMTQALVLAASAAGDERAGARMMRGRAAPAWLLRPLLPVVAGFASNRLLKAMYYDQSKITPDVRDAYLRPARIKGSMDGLLAMMRDRADDVPLDEARITMPVLILAGAHDPVVPLGAAQRLRERIPHARLVVIEKAAHGLLEERPDECARAIEDFLRESGVGAPGTTATA
jgi:pimeloyl-ACP methyl ester carboxylesterase